MPECSFTFDIGPLEPGEILRMAEEEIERQGGTHTPSDAYPIGGPIQWGKGKVEVAGIAANYEITRTDPAALAELPQSARPGELRIEVGSLVAIGSGAWFLRRGS